MRIVYEYGSTVQVEICEQKCLKTMHSELMHRYYRHYEYLYQNEITAF